MVLMEKTPRSVGMSDAGPGGGAAVPCRASASGSTGGRIKLIHMSMSSLHPHAPDPPERALLSDRAGRARGG